MNDIVIVAAAKCEHKYIIVNANSRLDGSEKSDVIIFYSVGGVKVSIVAFQAIDPGSIPG